MRFLFIEKLNCDITLAKQNHASMLKITYDFSEPKNSEYIQKTKKFNDVKEKKADKS